MDRAYLLQTKRPSIQEMGISIFRTAIFEEKLLQKKIIDGFCDLIGLDRAGQLSGQTLSQNAATLFHDLGVYTNTVEPRLLQVAQDYIMNWADAAAKSMPLADYARSSMNLMESELKRCETLGLDLSTRRDLEALLEHQLVQRQQAILCKSSQ
jgi:cullin-4